MCGPRLGAAGGDPLSHSSLHPHGLPPSLLQHLLSTLLLWGKASNGPDFDLNAVVELLPSHVPHALVGSCNGPVLQGKQTVRALPQGARAVVVLPIAKPDALTSSLHCQGQPWAIPHLSSSAVMENSPKLLALSIPFPFSSHFCHCMTLGYNFHDTYIDKTTPNPKPCDKKLLLYLTHMKVAQVLLRKKHFLV